jgi:hypothetical protein
MVFRGSQKSDRFQAANFGGLDPDLILELFVREIVFAQQVNMLQDTTDPFARAWNRDLPLFWPWQRGCVSGDKSVAFYVPLLENPQFE